MTSAIRWFRELDQTQIEVVGGKSANLGELVKHLASFAGQQDSDLASVGIDSISVTPDALPAVAPTLAGGHTR